MLIAGIINICDALQQNREQVAQAYFEIWAIKVGIGVKNESSVDFEIFFFLSTLLCLVIFQNFPTKILHFLQPVKFKSIGNFKY